MNKPDALITFYQYLIDESRTSLLDSKDFFAKESINLDIDYFLGLINDRVVFMRSMQRSGSL